MAEVKTYPVGTIAKLLMMTPDRVGQLAKEGYIPKSARGEYDLAGAVQGYIRFLKERMPGNKTDGKTPEIFEGKARKVNAEAEIAEMKAGKMRGDLVATHDVRRHLAGLATEVRTRMRNIPGRVAPSIVGDTDERRVKQILGEEIDQALSALADTKLFATPTDDEPGNDDEGGEENVDDGADPGAE